MLPMNARYHPMREEATSDEDGEGDRSDQFTERSSERRGTRNNTLVRLHKSDETPRLAEEDGKNRQSVTDMDPGLNAQIAASKAVSILMKMEQDGYCGVEQASVYGAAVAVPQIARSAGWPKTLVGLTIRVYIFLAVNFLIQGFLVDVINEEALVMNNFSGRPHLCDFGAALESCPQAPSCQGPGGTRITAPRLYSFGLWSTRTFVRDSLKALFPEKADEIQNSVDPGEYGIENWWCRLVCCFLFMMAVVDDLRASIELGYLLFLVPSANDFWIQYEEPEWADKDDAKAIHGWNELDLVKFQVRGMPRHWKLANAVFILVPKIVLWFGVTVAGFRFLMETAGIVDLVINAMALTFVLSIDEMIMERFGTVSTKYMLERLEAWPLFDTTREEEESPEEAFARRREEDKWSWYQDCTLLTLSIPKRLIFTIILMAIFMFKYYWTNCERTEDGTWVSKDMFLPKTVQWDPIALMLGSENAAEPYWTMPEFK